MIESNTLIELRAGSCSLQGIVVKLEGARWLTEAQRPG
jgi:hypothetical protein